MPSAPFGFRECKDVGSSVSENFSSRNCLINSWRASRPWCTAGARRQNGACLPPYTRSRDPKIGPTSIYQTVSRREILGNSKTSGQKKRSGKCDLLIEATGLYLGPLL